MSCARRCDVCNALYLCVRHKTISLDVNLDLNSEGSAIGWSEVSLCVACTAKVLKIIKPALRNFPRVKP